MRNYQTLQKNPNHSVQALGWWRGLTDEQRAEEHRKSEKREWTLAAFGASTKAVRDHWLKTVRNG